MGKEKGGGRGEGHGPHVSPFMCAGVGERVSKGASVMAGRAHDGVIDSQAYCQDKDERGGERDH